MSAYSDLVLATSGLVNFWKLDGSTADLKGSAPLSYGTAVSPGVGGRVIGDLATRFNRASASQSWVAAAPPALSGAHSVEYIFKIPSGTISTGWYIFGVRSTTFGTDMVIVASGAIQLLLGNGTATPYFIEMGSPTRDVWHHLVAAVGTDGSWQVFLDGASLATGIWTLTGTPLLFDATHNLTVGNYNRTFDANWAYAGWVQDFAVYNVKLSAATVAAHVAALGPEPVTVYLPGPHPFKTEAEKLSRTLLAVPAGHDVASSASVRPLSGQLWPRGNR